LTVFRREAAAKFYIFASLTAVLFLIRSIAFIRGEVFVRSLSLTARPFLICFILVHPAANSCKEFPSISTHDCSAITDEKPDDYERNFKLPKISAHKL